MPYLLWIGVALLLLYEVLSVSRATPHASISDLVWQLARCRPIVAFVAGMVAGHLFWQRVP